jgi:RNA polymerase sigma-70 factor (ECF subfamily)
VSSTGSVTKLIQRVKEGDGAAAQELLARYLRRLLGYARAKLRGRNLRAADEEDVVQSVLLGFYLGAERGQYSQCQDRDDLWHLLAKITEHKVQKLLRHEHAKKRCCPEAEAATSSPSSQETPAVAPQAKQPADPHLSPDLEVAAGEQVERLLALLKDKQLISIAVWKWDGYSNEEIAAMLGCSARTIQRKIRLIRTIWGEEEAES